MSPVLGRQDQAGTEWGGGGLRTSTALGLDWGDAGCPADTVLCKLPQAWIQPDLSRTAKSFCCSSAWTKTMRKCLLLSSEESRLMPSSMLGRQLSGICRGQVVRDVNRVPCLSTQDARHGTWNASRNGKLITS